MPSLLTPEPDGVGIPHLVRNNWQWGLPATLFLAIVGITLYRLFLHPLACFPGPLEARILGTWRNRRYWRGTWHEDVLEIHRKHGRIVRIAPNELSIVDAGATQKLYNHGTKALKTDWYNTWDDPSIGPIMFSETNKKMHSFLRKRVSSAYSMSALLRYETFIQDSLSLMLQKLRVKADRGEVIDMSKWTNNLAFDVAGTLAYGEPLGMLETESDVMGLQGMIHQGFYIMANLGHYWLQTKIIMNPLVEKIRAAFDLPDPFGGFRQWTRERITLRRQAESKVDREDMLNHFIRMKTANGGPVDDNAVLVEAMNIVGAGADTTSIGMRTCLFYLCKNEAIYHRVQQEIDTYYQTHELTGPITYQQTLELPLFCACIREATRLLPSIVYQLLRYAPEDLIVDGKTVPPGTCVGISPIAANRDEAVWGDDADTFNPSRWLEDADRIRFYNSHDMTFGGSGPRTCIGRNIALVEMHKFIAQLLHHFNVEFMNPEQPWTVFTQWFANQHDMHMKITYRGGLKSDK